MLTKSKIKEVLNHLSLEYKVVKDLNEEFEFLIAEIKTEELDSMLSAKCKKALVIYSHVFAEIPKSLEANSNIKTVTKGAFFNNPISFII